MPPLFQRGSRFSSSAGDDGRWQVVRKLGEGQFAEVYEVRDTNARDKDARVRWLGVHALRGFCFGAMQCNSLKCCHGL